MLCPLGFGMSLPLMIYIRYTWAPRSSRPTFSNAETGGQVWVLARHIQAAGTEEGEKTSFIPAGQSRGWSTKICRA